MKCPFETPVFKGAFMSADGLFRIRTADNKPLLKELTNDEADYIVQAINSHEKLVEALEIYGGHSKNCRKQMSKDKDNWGCICGYEQALKEAEKP